MKISEMSMTQLAVFTTVCHGLGVEPTSLEEARQIIMDGRKALDEMEKTNSKDINNKKVLLGEFEKILNKLDKGGYV